MPGLFKYFPASDTHKFERFLAGNVFLTPPKYFNDPWDFYVRTVSRTEAEIREEFEGFENEFASTLKEGEKEERFRKFAERIASPNYLKGEGPYFQQSLSELYGVVSLTSDHLNRLMWAHYADSHRGFVAEFRCSSEYYAQDFVVRNTPFGLSAKVSYVVELPRLENKAANAMDVYCRKHIAWEREKEWRVIQPLPNGIPDLNQADGKTYFLLPFKSNDLLRIIFGLRVCPIIRRRLSHMLTEEKFRGAQERTVEIDSETGELTEVELKN